jgi:predicted DNA-binding transcriptional regulator YafY
LGTVRENLYRIQPISLTTNTDGIVLEAIDLDDETYKTFLLNRIIDVFDNVEFKNNKKTKGSIIELKFNFEKETVLSGFNQKNIKVTGKQAIVTFYSESNAINFALNHFNEIEIITPQSIANEISIRKTKLIKKLKV